MLCLCTSLLTACGGGGSSTGNSVTANNGGAMDSTLPVISISLPTSAGSYTATQAGLTLSGNASDDVEVVEVSWSNSNGGSGRKNFGNKFVSWSFGLTLASGVNDVTVTARDAAGNTSTKTLRVTYTIATNAAVLVWNPNTEPDLAGYRVYYGTAPGAYQQVRGAGVVVNDTTYTVTGLTSGARYYFAVTAFDGSGNESDYSGEVIKDIP